MKVKEMTTFLDKITSNAFEDVVLGVKNGALIATTVSPDKTLMATVEKKMEDNVGFTEPTIVEIDQINSVLSAIDNMGDTEFTLTITGDKHEKYLGFKSENLDTKIRTVEKDEYVRLFNKPYASMDDKEMRLGKAENPKISPVCAVIDGCEFGKIKTAMNIKYHEQEVTFVFDPKDPHAMIPSEVGDFTKVKLNAEVKQSAKFVTRMGLDLLYKTKTAKGIKLAVTDGGEVMGVLYTDGDITVKYFIAGRVGE